MLRRAPAAWHLPFLRLPLLRLPFLRLSFPAPPFIVAPCCVMGAAASTTAPITAPITTTPATTTTATTKTPITTAEASLLALLTDTPYERSFVRLPSGHVLNTLSAGDPSNPALLLLHGWGSGAAFFGSNIALLAPHFRLHLVDWLGFGASSRPHHSLALAPHAAEAFFVDALAEWVAVMRQREPLHHFHVVGHSMGAFLAVSFALRFPHVVRTLVLASPVGLPRPPTNKIPTQGGWIRRIIFRLVFQLWERGYTPQFLLRASGARFGRRLAEWIIAPRFPTPDLRLRGALTEYFYQISTAGPSSGEHALSTILESGAYARLPLCDRLHAVRNPTVFLYGDRDWMSSDVAEKVRVGMKVKTAVKIVPDAGHHLYYDNAHDFARQIIDACAGHETPHKSISQKDALVIG